MSGKVTVTALCNMFEDGQMIHKGQKFQTTPERAKSLGSAVKAIQAKKKNTENTDKGKKPAKNRAETGAKNSR